MLQGPPRWVSWALRISAWIDALLGGLTVVLQWGLWMVVTSQIFPPYGIALGLVIAAVQILILNDREKDCG